jgi:hypothetical protein
MIQQKLFPFNMEITKDKLTSKAGLSIFAEYNHSVGLTELFPINILPLLKVIGDLRRRFYKFFGSSVNAGGTCLDDIRELKNEKELWALPALKRFPNPIP